MPGADSLGLEERLIQAAVERAEFRSLLKATADLNRQRTEMVLRRLESAESDRVKLREELESLTHEFDNLAEKLKKESIVGSPDRVQRKAVSGRGAQSRMAFRPSIEYAERQPTHVCELNHNSLASLAMQQDHSAHRERLLREAMSVDRLTWGQAHEVLNSFDQYNERYYWFETLPYRIGITLAFLCGSMSYALVFCAPLAEWYGVNVVGEELPEGIESINDMTVNQVGTWTWGWMEPMIGTASFVLLCAQFTRAQASKMHMKTYSDRILAWRAARLAGAFPQYDGSMVKAWAKHLPKVGYDFFPNYEAQYRQKGPASGL